jgi:hypothetical protein
MTLSSNRDFRWFWYGQVVSNVGDAFATVALPLLVLEATGSVTQMGYVTALAAGGQIAMSLFAGLVLDRVHRRRLMIATDLGRMILYASLPLAWGFRAHRIGLIYVVAGAGAAMGNLFSVGNVAAIANLVEKEQLREANSRTQASTALAYVIGPILAGAICARFGTATALWVDAGSFAVSATSMALVRFGANEAPSRVKEGGPIANLLAGFRFVFADRVLRRMQVFMSVIGLMASVGVGAAVIDLFIFRIRSDLAQSSAMVGVCLGVSALGAAAGAICSPRVGRRWGFAACFFGGTGLQGVGMIVGGVLPLVAVTILGGALWSGGLTLRAVAAISVRQERSPDALLGRTMAASWTATFGAACLGALFVTNLAARAGAGHALTWVGLALVTAALVGNARGVGLTSPATVKR